MKIVYAILVLASSLFSKETNEVQIVYDYYEGIEASKKTDKPILLFFTGQTCANNERVNELITKDKETIRKSAEGHITVVLYVDDQTKLAKEKKVIRGGRTITLTTKGNEWAHIEITKFNRNIQPMVVIADSNGLPLKEPIQGNISKQMILEYLN